jgi:DNA-binding NarL/FixJ family response regulator
VLEGGIYVSEAIGQSMVRKFANGASPTSTSLFETLSNREVQILHMIGKGNSTRESAKALNISIKTIESHRKRIKRKLNLSNGTQLLQYAINWFSRHSAEEAKQLGKLADEGERAA